VTRPPRRAVWPITFASVAAVLFGLAFAQFGPYLMRSDLDHGLHVRFAQRLLSQHVLLPHFVYHVLVALAAGFSPETADLLLAARVVLSLLVLAKLAVALGFARGLQARAGASLQPAQALVLAVAFFFVAPLPKWWRTENIYLGQLSPTVWHNPTAIAALPLAVVVFWLFVRMRAERPVDDLKLGALLALSIAVKPNFALAFLPAAALLRLVWRDRPFAKEALGLACLAAPSLLVLAWQYRQALALGLEARGEGMVTVQPFEVWGIYSPNPLASTLVSLVFPLAVVAVAIRHALGASDGAGNGTKNGSEGSHG